MPKREFDVIVYGATGYTGRLVGEYIQQQYGDSDLKWAMAGRSAKKLDAVAAEMGIAADIPKIVADSADADSLIEMAKRAKSIITTVGPYQLYGTELVRACAENGTDYVDLCGEPAWMHDTVREFQAAAENSGARIVHSCGFDSIPFDLGVYYTQEKAKAAFGETCPTIRGRVRKMQGKFSGGTAASFMESMKRAGRQPEVLDWLKDPFTLTPDFEGPRQPHGAKPIEETDLGSWSAPFIMASINTKNIHRSNALLGHAYGEDFVYDEMMMTGPGEAGEQMAKGVMQMNASMGVNPPKPGEGPTKDERENGFYDVMFVGDTKSGKRIITSVAGDKDPGYGSTSKMIAEAAICLARDIDQADVGGGIYTPAPAMGMALINRLEKNAGLTFKLEQA
ncbi:MAG: saccharopine dehydrogenase [Hellea sp.]|nr:saccharopine dehydrogenase [Hellea sp.]